MLSTIYEYGIIPTIRIDKEESAVDLAKTLISADLSIAEITFRTPAAKNSIKAIKNNCPEIIVGAGTIYTKTQVDDALEAGASFIVSPAFDPKIVEYCKEKNITIFPGINNSYGVAQAIEMDVKCLKFFPAEASGGFTMLKSLSEIAPNIKFIPSGGIELNNIESYLAVNSVVACGVTWLTSPTAINNKEFLEIKHLVKQAIMQVIGLEYFRTNINHPNDTEANKSADKMNDLFGYSIVRELPYSYLMNKDFKLKKNSKYGSKGAFSFFVKDMKRALAYFKRKRLEIIEDSAEYDANGNIIFVYLEDEIAGFALNFIQKPNVQKNI